MNTMRLALIALALTWTSAHAEDADPMAPYKKLGFLVGSWKIDGTQKETPFGGPSGKFVGTLVCTQFTGGFQVVCNGDSKIGGTIYRELAAFGYDAEARAYTWFDLDSTGMNALAKGAVTGKSWAYTFEMPAGGETVKLNVIIEQVAPTKLHNVASYSIDGAAPTTFLDLTLTKST